MFNSYEGFAMEVVTFHFHSNNGIMSKLIEWKTASHISHVSVEVKGYYYNAYAENRFYKTKVSPDDIEESYSFVVNDIIGEYIIQLLDNYVDTLYDFRSMFGFLLNKKRHSSGRVYCSEIANMVFELIIGTKIDYKRLISPEMIRIAIIYYQHGLENSSKQKSKVF